MAAERPTPEYHLLVKPAGADCNAACDYCFYLRAGRLYDDAPHRMTEEVLRAFIPPFLAEGHPVSVFCWQGGEPTLMGLPFFRTVVRLQQEHGADGQLVGNALQTNGVLIDEEWARFLAEYRFLVGLSIDGPEEIHDAHRRRADGSGTWGHAIRTAGLLREHGVEFNILSVVNSTVAERGREVYRWLVGQGFRHLQFIQCAEVGPDGELAPWAVTPEAYGRFLCEVFDEWADGGYPDVSVRTFDHFLSLAAGRTTGLCIFDDACEGHLVIEHNGDVYPCDFFVREDTKLGNVLVDDIRDLARSRGRAEFAAAKGAARAACGDCRFWPICHGGCVKDREARCVPSPAEQPTIYCESYRRFFAHSRGWFEKAARALV